MEVAKRIDFPRKSNTQNKYWWTITTKNWFNFPWHFHEKAVAQMCRQKKILDSWNKMPTWSIEWFFSWALLSSQSHSHTTCAHFVRWANRLHAFVLISHAKEREYEENVIEDLIGCGNEEEKHDYYEDIRRSGIIFPLPPNPNVPSVI